MSVASNRSFVGSPLLREPYGRQARGEPWATVKSCSTT